MRDLGFAIPPGTHALVGVRLNEVSSGGMITFVPSGPSLVHELPLVHDVPELVHDVPELT